MNNLVRMIVVVLMGSAFSVYGMEKQTTSTPPKIDVKALSSIRRPRDTSTPLSHSIKSLMRLSLSCRYFHSILPYNAIGDLYKHCAQEEKNSALAHVVHTSQGNYEAMRLPIRILIHAGAAAEAPAYNVLHDAVYQEDDELVAFMFKHGADPNMKFVIQPMLAHVKTLSIARIFLQKGANSFSTTYQFKSDVPNLLWSVAKASNREAELLKLYLAHGIDPKVLDSLNDNDCLLHCLADTYYVHFGIDCLQKANILLTVIPDMINAVNAKGCTPLDCAELSLKQICKSSRMYKPSDEAEVVTLELIRLFKQAGGKRACELQ